MPTIKNMSYGPISLAIGGGEKVTLKKGETAELNVAQLRLKEIKQLLDEGKLAIVPGDTVKQQVSQSF